MDRALRYYSISLPLIVSILVIIIIEVLEPFGIKSGLFDPSFKIGMYFTIWGFSIALITVIQADRKMEKLEKSIKEIKESRSTENHNNNTIVNETDNKKIQLPKYSFLFFIGITFLLTGCYLYAIPNHISDRPAVQTWEGISLTHNAGFNFTNFEFNFATPGNNQYLHMYYNIFPMKSGMHYALLILPYVGKLENFPDTGWMQYNVSSSKTSILYKEFNCDKDYSLKCHDDKNLYFDLQEKIDAKQYYIHSINIPFAPMLQTATVDKVNEILKGKGEIEQGWKIVDTTPKIRVTVNDTVTQINPIPDGYMTSFKVQPRNVSATVFVWSLPDHDITFHLDYTNPEERQTFDDQRNISLILIGSGVSFLGVALAEGVRKKHYSGKKKSI